jgi:hypothetical protein
LILKPVGRGGGRSELEKVAGFQAAGIDADAIQESAMRALLIGHFVVVAYTVNRRVTARHEGFGEYQILIERSPDGRGGAFQWNDVFTA